MKEGRKRIGGLIALFFTAIALFLLVAATASAAEGPAVMVTGYTVEPGVLMPARSHLP
jgi:hypothetical protein